MTKFRNAASVLLVSILVIATPCAAAKLDANKAPLRFGVVPQQAAAKLAKSWTPIMKYLSDKTGVKVVFNTAPSIPEFESRLARGAYDVAYMNPYHYTVFNKEPGYQALAKAKDKRIKGILVVAESSDITEIEQLHGSTLAFPAPAAFAASVLPRAELGRREIEFTPKYVSSHDSVYRAVAKGLFPAGGGVLRTLANVDPAIRAQLRVLWTTRGYTPHAVATHPRVSNEVVGALANALATLQESEHGMKMLRTLKLKGFVRARNADWDDVRALGLNKVDDLVARKQTQ